MEIEFLSRGGADLVGEVGEIAWGLEFDFAVFHCGGGWVVVGFLVFAACALCGWGFFFLFVGEIVDFLYSMDGLRKLLRGGYARFFGVVGCIYRVVQ